MRAQTVVVVATMRMHNFVCRNGRLDESFLRAKKVDDDEVEIDLLDEQDDLFTELDEVAEDDMSW